VVAPPLDPVLHAQACASRAMEVGVLLLARLSVPNVNIRSVFSLVAAASMLKVNMADGVGAWRLWTSRPSHCVSSRNPCPAAPCSSVLLTCPMFDLPSPSPTSGLKQILILSVLQISLG